MSIFSRQGINKGDSPLINKGILNYFELEYIDGETLESLLDKQKKGLNKREVMKYGEDIFNGLCELRQLGIFHRDVWLGNIMIDKEEDRAVIIDLGSSTDNPNESPVDNRRYGGENDLVSLGQIMYKMAIGRHIFNTSVDTSTSFIPGKIKKEREKIYADKSLLEKRLEQAKTGIKDPQIAKIIEVCLKANAIPEDYHRISQLFCYYNDSRKWKKVNWKNQMPVDALQYMLPFNEFYADINSFINTLPQNEEDENDDASDYSSNYSAGTNLLDDDDVPF